MAWMRSWLVTVEKIDSPGFVRATIVCTSSSYRDIMSGVVIPTPRGIDNGVTGVRAFTTKVRAASAQLVATTMPIPALAHERRLAEREAVAAAAMSETVAIIIGQTCTRSSRIHP